MFIYAGPGAVSFDERVHGCPVATGNTEMQIGPGSSASICG
jgi:hypothetical protein